MPLGTLDNDKIKENKILENIKPKKYIIKKCMIELIKEFNNIDYVFPYVTSDDPYWRELFEKTQIGNETKWGSGKSRFRDNGMLKYLFRSLDTHLPWINKVHMIVMSDSQVPKWLNREQVHIIYHSDFIPKQ